MGDRYRKPGRNAWHHGFAELVSERAPADADLSSEVELSRRPSRVDLVIIRRRAEPWRHGAGTVLKGLWPQLAKVTLVDFKSPTHDLRRTELARLVGYGWQYLDSHDKELSGRHDLTLALVTPSRNTGFDRALAKYDWAFTSLGNGYGRIDGVSFTLITAFTNEVSDAEADEFLRIFSHHRVRDPDAIDWFHNWAYTLEQTVPAIKESRSFQEVRAKFLSSMTPEERLAGLPPQSLLQALLDSDGIEEALSGLSASDRELVLAKLARFDSTKSR